MFDYTNLLKLNERSSNQNLQFLRMKRINPRQRRHRTGILNVCRIKSSENQEKRLLSLGIVMHILPKPHLLIHITSDAGFVSRRTIVLAAIQHI